jgi:hypothetical protein
MELPKPIDYLNNLVARIEDTILQYVMDHVEKAFEDWPVDDEQKPA